MIRRMFSVAGAVALAAFAFGAPKAEASTCDILNFTTSTACISLDEKTYGPGGNVTAGVLNSMSAFGITGWMELDKIDRQGNPPEGSTATSNNGFFNITYQAPLYKQGLWSLSDEWLWGAGQFAFGIKGAKDSAVYLMDVAFRNGTWFVNDLSTPSGKTPDMSNIRLFGTTPLAPIPLPAAGWLLIAALGGLFVMGRRRRAAA